MCECQLFPCKKHESDERWIESKLRVADLTSEKRLDLVPKRDWRFWRKPGGITLKELS